MTQAAQVDDLNTQVKGLNAELASLKEQKQRALDRAGIADTQHSTTRRKLTEAHEKTVSSVSLQLPLLALVTDHRPLVLKTTLEQDIIELGQSIAAADTQIAHLGRQLEAEEAKVARLAARCDEMEAERQRSEGTPDQVDEVHESVSFASLSISTPH